MPQQYKVTVNGTYEFLLSEKDLEAMDLLRTSEDRYHVLKGDNPFAAEIVDSDFLKRNYRVKVKNDIYEVSLQNDLDQQIARMGFSLGSTKNISSSTAPMPGLI